MRSSFGRCSTPARCGFKCFLVDSGVPEFGYLDAAGLEEALNALRGTGAPLLVHAELPEHIHAPARRRAFVRAATWPRRPRQAEDEAIALVFALARKTGTHAHIVHLSSANGLDALRLARKTRRAADRRDDAALPLLRRRARARRRDGVQVRAADPRARQPRGAVARRRRGTVHRHRQRPLAVHAGAEADAGRRHRARVGRHRVAAIEPVDRLDRGASGGRSRSRRSSR